MDDILKSIRRIIRSDQEEAKLAKEPIRIERAQEPPARDDDNLIRMKIHDQKRLRILEKKLQTIEAEYEQKLQLHRRKMADYRRQNQELIAAVEACKSKLDVMSDSLKNAHGCLEKLQVKNKALKDKILEMSSLEQGGAVLKTIQTEFANLYHPDLVAGDNLSRIVRHEVYNEFSQVLQGVESRFQSRRL
jgi:chromosome segregation ATPase